MQRPQEPGEWDGLPCMRFMIISSKTPQPRHYIPRPQIARSRLTDAAWRRHRDRQVLCQLWQPTLLVRYQAGGETAARETHGEVIAEPKHCIIPSGLNPSQWQMGQIRVLSGHQSGNQLLGNSEGRGH
jgi:hypothetical protein